MAEGGGRQAGTRLTAAVLNDDAATLRDLLDDVDLDVNDADSSGDTALHHAAGHGHLGLFEMLLARHDIDPNAKNIIGATPLARAVASGNDAIVRLLLARPDVDVNLVDAHRSTALHYAIANRDEHLVTTLLSHAATNIDITNRPFHETALEVALGVGDDRLVGLLRQAASVHSFGDVLSEHDNYVERAEPTHVEPIPRMPYDDEPWPRL
jgi:ankyrin repeat protein